jgi:predicted O-methyltransferase YrrM
MIALAQLQKFVTLTQINLYMDGSVDDISVLAEREIKGSKPSSSTTSLHIHFLFIDHDKDLYLLDLKKLERSSLVKQGSCVVADNVIFAHIDDYLNHVKALQDKHVVRTRTIESIVEYSHGNIQDGLGTCLPFIEYITCTNKRNLTLFCAIQSFAEECTKYIQDPLGFR